MSSSFVPISFFCGVVFSIYLNAKTCKNKSGIMAKLKSPLLSFEAHGVLGDVLVYFTRGGTSYVRSKPQDPVSLSIAQGLLRDCFASAAVSAHSLTQGQKDSYAALAPNSAFCPWWNNFIGQYIKDYYEVPSVATTFIKSVQICIATIPNGDYWSDTVISSIDHLKAVPFLLGIAPASTNPQDFICYSTFLDTTHLRLVRNNGTKLGALTAAVMVWEIEPDFLVSLRGLSIAYASGETLVNFEIDPVVLSKAILFPRGGLCEANVSPDKYNWYADFSDNTHVRIRRTTSGSAGHVILYVGEFI